MNLTQMSEILVFCDLADNFLFFDKNHELSIHFVKRMSIYTNKDGKELSRGGF